MIKGIEDVQRANQQGMETAIKVWGDWSKGWQSIAAEWSDYTKRSFEDGTQAWERMAAARSLDQVVEIQTQFARRAYDDYMTQMSRIASLCTDMAREAYRPMGMMSGSEH